MLAPSPTPIRNTEDYEEILPVPSREEQQLKLTKKASSQGDATNAGKSNVVCGKTGESFYDSDLAIVNHKNAKSYVIPSNDKIQGLIIKKTWRFLMNIPSLQPHISHS